MQSQKNVIDCYNKTAREYAHKFGDELRKKHLDCILLQSFASRNAAKGTVIDLGCGPGQTTRFLFDSGCTDIIGTDLSSEMISVASKLHPQIKFETADMLRLTYAGNRFGSAIAFYSIVHLDYDQIKTAFTEVKRILRSGGEFLFSFHIGNDTIHLDQFLDQQVDIDFYFFEASRIVNILQETRFEIIDIIEREPYRDVEHPSRRAYIWAKKSKQTRN